MGRHVKVWTPEMVLRLRELSRTYRDPTIARILGLSYFAVKAKQRELRLLDSNYEGLDEERIYTRKYVASLAAVRSIGVEELQKMSHEECRLALFRAGRSLRRDPSEAGIRIARMVQLSERIAKADRFLERLA